MELVNIHTHTGLSGHGEGTVDELVQAARAAHITTLAVTEHYPLSHAFDPEAYLSMSEESVDFYLEALDTARATYPDIEIISGCEMDWLGDYEDRSISKEDLAPFSIVLGSVHFVDAWPFDDPAQRARWEEPGAPDFIWKRYFELWCDAVLSSSPFTIMAHPDLAKKFGYYPSFDVEPLYREAAEAAHEAGRMVEVNTSGLFYACKEMFPAPALLSEFAHAGVPCTVGTDAHTPENVAREITAAYRLMAQAGYKTVTVPTIHGDRREITIV